MFKKFLVFFTGLFLMTGVTYAERVSDNGNVILSMESYLRNDVVTFNNIADLDSNNSDDATVYFGLDYSLGFKAEFKNTGPIFYLKLERNGPSDNDAPLFVHNTLMNTGGVIEKYRNDELLPQLEEFWLDTALLDDVRFKAGLYAYEVGNSFSLNGAYENYGFTIYREYPDSIWRLYYCRPDIVYKNHLGPRIRQEEEQGYKYEHGAANFFAVDAKFKQKDNYLQPYIGVLSDYTSSGKRDNLFTTPVKRDILGTLGAAVSRKNNNLFLILEAAHNFGKAESDSPDYKDVYHTGYMFYGEIDYLLGKITPKIQFLAGSGNKVSLEDASSLNSTLLSAKNRAFSYTSPLNYNLSDSISASHSDIRPIVAMGSGYGLNYGVPRPRTFAISDFDNIVITSSGFDFEINSKLSVGIYGYYLRSFYKGVGMFDNQPKRLSAELGYETDFLIDYRINKNFLISFLGGYFIPGQYHKELRDDTSGSLFSPYTRGDGKADAAYQWELAAELKF